ncbi:MAG: AMP-binding protein [Hydrogenophaga sp.]|uniref:AMP-binding protein n=1 Tax=Hydrogenophaga sp. TaxID=1904254 RepID=UPI002AB83C89|nr:AMP-binding protein [Hydrogenophaga sp.]MDZ4188103.1 AMP-binding protein [Hydrogenophaga sp.]
MNEPRPRQDDLRSIEHPGLSPAPDLEWLLPRLLATVRCVSDELRPQARLAATLGLDHSLERDYGLDSLARVELIARVDRDLGVALGEAALTEAETPRDLLRFITRTGGRAADTAGPVEPRSTQQPPVADTAPESYPPDAVQTLVAVFEWHLQRHPDRVLITLYENGDQPVDLSYADLHRDALALAAGLRALGLDRGDKVAIMLPTGREFFAAFFGALVAGAVPVPLYPPARPSQLEDHLKRITGIMRNAQARVLVTVERAKPLAHLLRAQVETLQTVGTVADLSLADSPAAPAELAASDIAFLQYTSGSTGDPKGVILTHANLLANLRAMWRASKVSSTDTFVSWLPLYHDMGLIGAWLGSFTVGFRLVVMSPLAFLGRPRRWLEAISHHGGTLSAGPNFAYELCMNRIDDAAMVGLDLSRWRLAFNGAEAVSPDTVTRFGQRFAACGLSPTAMTPVYGLAEASVGLLFPPLGRGPRIDTIERDTFEQERRAVPSQQTTALRFVACGRVLPGHRIRIVDGAGQPLPERVEGRLEFCGPSATAGYWHAPDLTARLFSDDQGEWLDTGDRAYLAEGEVFVTGRVKDIVIRGGRNLYPQEIEQAVGEVKGVRTGCVAVFGLRDTGSGTERLVVLAEVSPREARDTAALHEAVSRAVVAAIGEPADDILLVPPHTVLKTSSGKVRRAACRSLVEQGGLNTPKTSVRAQWLRLALGALGLRLHHGLQRCLSGWFGVRAFVLFWLMVPAAWLVTVLLPTQPLAWRFCHRAARLLLRLAGATPTVHGLEHLPADARFVLVSNHASYLDGLLLVAALDRPVAFVAKRELERQWVAGRFLKRLGAAFVERFDPRRSVADAQHMADVVQSGQALMVFPEGTFVAAPGLLPFRLGGFLAAATAKVPVVPVTLGGTRQLLGDGRWWPRPAVLSVHFGAPLTVAPELETFSAAVQLRDRARRVIARRLASTET